MLYDSIHMKLSKRQKPIHSDRKQNVSLRLIEECWGGVHGERLGDTFIGVCSTHTCVCQNYIVKIDACDVYKIFLKCV